MPKKVIKKVEKTNSESYLDKIEAEVQANQSKFNLVLGGLIILVVGLLVFNYFSKDKADLGPAQQTEQITGDVAPDKLPGKYTVKDGDTLFLIAQKYYNDGEKYSELVKANNLPSADAIQSGQVLEIPKLGEQTAKASSSPESTPTMSASPEATPTVAPSAQVAPSAPSAPQVTGQTNNTDWGAPITGTSYTVQEGDWLSTIAARAYKGDIMAYQKIAAANNISNPDYIQAGMVITIPR